jgi:hypothetical protein
MADNVTITAGAGTIVSTDELTIDTIAQQVQRIKVGLGANNAYQQDLANGQATLANSLPVGIASDQSMIPTGGVTKVISATLTRPANVTAYAAGNELTDTGAAIQTLTGIATKTGGSGEIRSIGMSCSTGTPAQLEVWLFDTTSTPQTNNTAFAPADSVVDTCIGVVPLFVSFQGSTGPTGNLFYTAGPLEIPFVTVGSANLYLRVVVRAAYTPGANSDTYKFRVGAVVDP